MVKETLSIILMICVASVAHGAVYMSHSFESDTTGDNPDYIDPVSNAGFTGTGTNIVAESNGVTPRTGEKMLQMPGLTGAQQDFTLGSQQAGDVYVAFYIYYPDGTEPNHNAYVHRDGPSTDNNKLIRIWGDVRADEYINMGASSEKGGTGDVERIYLEAKSGSVPDYHGCSGSMTAMYVNQVRLDSYYWQSDDLGRWIHYEFHFHRDTGVGDGVNQMWIDGVLVLSATSIPYTDAPCDPGYFRNGYLLGAANSGFDDPTYIYIDDVKFSDTYIGIDGNITCYPDVDGDLYPGSGSESVETCSTDYYISSHFTSMVDDCDDTDPSIHVNCSGPVAANCIGGVNAASGGVSASMIQ